jgi:hypothetical protein
MNDGISTSKLLGVRKLDFFLVDYLPFHDVIRLNYIFNSPLFYSVAPGITGKAGTALGIIRIVDPVTPSPTNSNDALPTTQDWSDSLGGACLDLDVSTMRPLVPQDACTNIVGRVNCFLKMILPHGNSDQHILLGFFFN